MIADLCLAIEGSEELPSSFNRQSQICNRKSRHFPAFAAASFPSTAFQLTVPHHASM
jgi:hypothetical protein